MLTQAWQLSASTKAHATRAVKHPAPVLGFVLMYSMFSLHHCDCSSTLCTRQHYAAVSHAELSVEILIVSALPLIT